MYDCAKKFYDERKTADQRYTWRQITACTKDNMKCNEDTVLKNTEIVENDGLSMGSSECYFRSKTWSGNKKHYVLSWQCKTAVASTDNVIKKLRLEVLHHSSCNFFLVRSLVKVVTLTRQQFVVIKVSSNWWFCVKQAWRVVDIFFKVTISCMLR